jgi:3-hydroxybutyryl-CoA dehydratase
MRTWPQRMVEMPRLEFHPTQTMISAWAELTRDWNPLHTDPAYAASTRFGGTIAHGHLALAFINEWAMAWAGPRWSLGGRLIGIRFVAPIRPGRTYAISGLGLTDGSTAGAVLFAVVDIESGRECVVGRAELDRSRSHRPATHST